MPYCNGEDRLRVTIIILPFGDKLDIHLEKVDDKRYENLKFGFNYRVFTEDGWTPIVRYDNHTHKGKIKNHLHRIDKEWDNPIELDMDLISARKYIEKLGKELRDLVVVEDEDKNNG